MLTVLRTHLGFVVSLLIGVVGVWTPPPETADYPSTTTSPLDTIEPAETSQFFPSLGSACSPASTTPVTTRLTAWAVRAVFWWASLHPKTANQS
jgi:hypothetical protein